MKKYLLVSFLALFILGGLYVQKPSLLKNFNICFTFDIFGVEASAYLPCFRKNENCSSPLKGKKPCCGNLTCKLPAGKKNGPKKCL